MKVIIGADPEVFVCDEQSVRSVIGKVGGSKAVPMQLPLGDGFAVQEDNVALEFNIPPSGSRADFIKNIATATGFLEQMMIDRYGMRFSHESAVSFPESEMYAPEAFEFGCDPDFDAWNMKMNPKPKADDPFLRSAGGHVHIQLDGEDPMHVIKLCDLFMGVPSVLMDKGELRKQLYGKKGAFRKKSFGVEYRTLSNFWIFDEKLTGWVYDSVTKVLEAAQQGLDIDAEEDNICEAINNNNKDVALQLVNKYNLTVL